MSGDLKPRELKPGDLKSEDLKPGDLRSMVLQVHDPLVIGIRVPGT